MDLLPVFKYWSIRLASQIRQEKKVHCFIFYTICQIQNVAIYKCPMILFVYL